MKVKVINSFRDRITKVIHQPGEELELDEQRISEIKAAGNFIIEIKEPKKPDGDNMKSNAEDKKSGSDDKKPKKSKK